MPWGLALESASLDLLRCVSGLENKTHIAGGETERCGVGEGQFPPRCSLPFVDTEPSLALFLAAFPRMGFLAPSYGQGALESALRPKEKE